MSKIKVNTWALPSAHSAYKLYLGGQSRESIHSSRFSPCYATIFFGTNFKKVLLFFGEDLVTDSCLEYVNWVLNRSFWADAFVTKNPREGFLEGFELDLHQDLALVQSGAMVLRHPFEWFGTWSWHHFREVGFSEEECFALASNYTVFKNYLMPFRENSNHLVVQRKMPFNFYNGFGYKDSGHSFLENPKRTFSLSNVNFGCDMAPLVDYEKYVEEEDILKEIRLYLFGNVREIKRLKNKKSVLEAILKGMKEV